jgi:hypothetical protein
MKWLKINGCPWNAETLKAAIEHGNTENIRWLVDQGCPISDTVTDCEYI